MTFSSDPTSRMAAGYHGPPDSGRAGIAKFRERVSRPVLPDNPDRERSVVAVVAVPVPAIGPLLPLPGLGVTRATYQERYWTFEASRWASESTDSRSSPNGP